MAYLEDEAILRLAEGEKVDVLITHHGPARVQVNHGAPSLDVLLDAEVARVWFHGHSAPNMARARYGPNGGTLVVPLGDIAFPGRDEDEGPGKDGWSWARFGDDVEVERKIPPFWREFRRRRWRRDGQGGLVCPELAQGKWWRKRIRQNRQR